MEPLDAEAKLRDMSNEKNRRKQLLQRTKETVGRSKQYTISTNNNREESMNDREQDTSTTPTQPLQSNDALEKAIGSRKRTLTPD